MSLFDIISNEISTITEIIHEYKTQKCKIHDKFYIENEFDILTN